MQDSNVKPGSYLAVLAFPAGFLILGLAVNLVLSSLLEPLSQPRMTGTFLKYRMSEAVEKLPAVHQSQGKYIYFWGASEIESALDTNLINQLLAAKGLDLKAVNMGMRSVHPVVYRAFTDRIASELEKSGKRIEVSMVKFPANKLTRVYRNSYRESDVDDQLGPILRPEYWEFAKDRPLPYLSGILHHYFLLDYTLLVPSEMLMDYLKSFHANPEMYRQKLYFSIWTDRKFLESENWSSARAGTYNWNLPESEKDFVQALEAKKTYNVRYTSYHYFERCCGLSSLDFDEHLLDDFIQTIEILKRVSNRVYIYTIPETDEFNLWRATTYDRKMTGILRRVQRLTEVEVIDTAGKVHLDEDDYLDFLHLGAEGQRKFYDYLFGVISEAR